jgi:hypothetical protein
LTTPSPTTSEALCGPLSIPGTRQAEDLYLSQATPGHYKACALLALLDAKTVLLLSI